jgi:hypothetical protein
MTIEEMVEQILELYRAREIVNIAAVNESEVESHK